MPDLHGMSLLLAAGDLRRLSLLRQSHGSWSARSMNSCVIVIYVTDVGRVGSIRRFGPHTDHKRRPMDSSIEKPLERLVAACHGETLQLKGEREESSNGRKDDDKLHKGQLPHQGLRPWSRPHRGDRGEDDRYEQSLSIWSHHFDLVSPRSETTLARGVFISQATGAGRSQAVRTANGQPTR